MTEQEASISTKNSLVHVIQVFATIMFIINIISKLFLQFYVSAITTLALVACMTLYFRAYFRHEKNMMKALCGSICMWFFMDDISFIGNYLIPNYISGGEYNSTAGILCIVLEIIVLICVVIIFIEHVIMGNDHKSNLHRNTVNIALIFLIAFCYLAIAALEIIVSKCSLWPSVEYISWGVGSSLLFAGIVTIDSIINTYKEEREGITY